MKIINLSYRRFEIADPAEWITGFRLFYGIWEELARQHEVLFFHFGGQQSTITENGIRHCFLRKSKNALLFPFSLNRRIQDENPDFVLVHDLNFPWQVLMLSIQVPNAKIRVQHHAEPPVQNSIKRWIQKLADRKTGGYFFTGKELAKPWLDAGLISNPEKIFELMEVSSVFEKKSKSICKNELNLPAAKIILWVGHLNENKNPLLAISAFLRMQREENAQAALYLIFQSEQLLPQLKQLLNKNEAARSGVHLIGKVPHVEMQAWYSAADFILSTSDYEGSGTAVCEAMSCGCVPVLSDIPSFRFIRGSSGFLAERGNIAAFSDALKAALNADYEIESRKVQKRFEEALSFEAIARQLEQILT